MEPQLPAKKTVSKKKIVLGLLIAIIACCVLCLAYGMIFNSTPSGKATLTAKSINKETDSEAKTETSKPTNTFTITVAPSKTVTLTSTLTPIPPTSTITNTSISPAELTATASEATKQAKSYQSTAAQAAKIATATYVAEFKEVPWRELSTYPDNFLGKMIIVRGRVFNVVSETEFQMYFAGTYEAVYVVMDEPYSDIFKNDAVTIYGLGLGKMCGTNAFGGQICQPGVSGTWFEKK